VEDDRDHGRRLTELLLERPLHLRRLEVVEDEPARAKDAGRAGRERDRQEEQDGPGTDHPPPPAVDEAAQPLEDGHVSVFEEEAGPDAAGEAGGRGTPES
jgi:hypothetical protein